MHPRRRVPTFSHPPCRDSLQGCWDWGALLLLTRVRSGWLAGWFCFKFFEVFIFFIIFDSFMTPWDQCFGEKKGPALPGNRDNTREAFGGGGKYKPGAEGQGGLGGFQ